MIPSNSFALSDNQLCIFGCCCWVAKLCSTLHEPMDCSLPGPSVLGISQERMLEWVAISFSRGSSWPRDQSCISCLAGQILYCWQATREASVDTLHWQADVPPLSHQGSPYLCALKNKYSLLVKTVFVVLPYRTSLCHLPTVISGKFLNFSESVSLFLKWGYYYYLPHKGSVRTPWDGT